MDGVLEKKLFPKLKPNPILKVVVKALRLMAVPGAAHMCWKAIRAGHATEMAANGSSLAANLEAGEWRPSAFPKLV